jgi:hypothetical protein
MSIDINQWQDEPPVQYLFFLLLWQLIALMLYRPYSYIDPYIYVNNCRPVWYLRCVLSTASVNQKDHTHTAAACTSCASHCNNNGLSSSAYRSNQFGSDVFRSTEKHDEWFQCSISTWTCLSDQRTVNNDQHETKHWMYSEARVKSSRTTPERCIAWVG